MDKIPNTADRLINIKEVTHLAGISRSQVYNLMNSNLFPSSLNLSPGTSNRCARWSVLEIHDWIEQKKAERASA